MADPNDLYNFDSQPDNDFEKISAPGDGFDQDEVLKPSAPSATGAGENDPQDGEISTTTENLQGEDEAEEDRYNAIGASEVDAYSASSPDPFIALDDEPRNQDPWEGVNEEVQPSAPVPETENVVEPLIDLVSSADQDSLVSLTPSAPPAKTIPDPIPSSNKSPVTDFIFESQSESNSKQVTESDQSSEAVETSKGNSFSSSTEQVSSTKPVTTSEANSRSVSQEEPEDLLAQIEIYKKLVAMGSVLKSLDPRDSVQEVDNSIAQFFVDLIYWRDVKKTGVVFGSMLVLLLSLAIFSLVSVLAYLSLAVLTVTFSFVVYKKIMGAVQKSTEGHPFKSLLEKDISLSEEKLKSVIDALLKNINRTVPELRRLFLIEDLVDSIKFGLLLWVLTYVGCLFNGMTIIILDVIMLFTLPKVYETYQVQIDNYIGLAKAKVNNVLKIVQSKVPFLKKKDKAQ